MKREMRIASSISYDQPELAHAVVSRDAHQPTGDVDCQFSENEEGNLVTLVPGQEVIAGGDGKFGNDVVLAVASLVAAVR